MAPHKSYGSEDSIEATVSRDLHSVNDSSKRTVKDVEFEVLDDEEEEIVTVRSPKRERPPGPGKGSLGSAAYTARPYAKQQSREDNKTQSSAAYALPPEAGSKVIKPKPHYPDGAPIKPKSIPMDNAAREMSKSSEQLSPRGKDMLTKENLANLEARLRLVNIAGSPESSPSNVRKSPAKTAGNAEAKGPSGKPPVPLPKSRPVSATEKTLKAKPTPPPSSSSKPEDEETDTPKKNSVWYEYGCV